MLSQIAILNDFYSLSLLILGLSQHFTVFFFFFFSIIFLTIASSVGRQ